MTIRDKGDAETTKHVMLSEKKYLCFHAITPNVATRQDSSLRSKMIKLWDTGEKQHKRLKHKQMTAKNSRQNAINRDETMSGGRKTITIHAVHRI